ncbi:hypothetical protein [Thalassovita taeanensis]|uniref:Uncharacterized protein n=1 Tax=Thalassovita taeanensis TaxID=657014 RepID=A0A1H9EWC4_9RHOB|nr:hypothetical protein [Thalassovita taeanensis]SEQ29955.1 hypothetical protein SAMN04488092_105196 [Thalassovita taeanensis]
MNVVTLPQIAAALGISRHNLRGFWNVARPQIQKSNIRIGEPRRGRGMDAYPYPEVVEYMRRVMPHRWNAKNDERLYQIMKDGEFIDVT